MYTVSGLEFSIALYPKVLVIVDAKPRDLGLPTDAYYAVEEVHDVSNP